MTVKEVLTLIDCSHTKTVQLAEPYGMIICKDLTDPVYSEMFKNFSVLEIEADAAESIIITIRVGPIVEA